MLRYIFYEFTGNWRSTSLDTFASTLFCLIEVDDPPYQTNTHTPTIRYLTLF